MYKNRKSGTIIFWKNIDPRLIADHDVPVMILDPLDKIEDICFGEFWEHLHGADVLERVEILYQCLSRFKSKREFRAEGQTLEAREEAFPAANCLNEGVVELWFDLVLGVNI